MHVGPLDFLVNVSAIVYVEMTLKWNDISDVHSLSTPGQFMPFFISLAQLLSVFYGLAKGAVILLADDSSLSGLEEEGEDDDLPCLHSTRGWHARGQTEQLHLTTTGA